ncbi:MAG: medium chain dehydrogenase/reductase family protein [Leptospiraceae bacterium]|nr:medium chain dehydrogenase/reductase family protein [Leptospiraceae bacterium]
MLKRKVHRIDKAGNLNSLQLKEETLDSPSKNEVTIQVKAVGLNFADVFAITGLYSATPKSSFIPGLEFSGEIITLGDNVKGFKLGDKVMGVTRFGAYATHINIQTDYIRLIPKSWSYLDGASFVVQALTAYYALVPLGAIEKNQTVLIHSAAGGVGILANRIAKKWNAFTIGTIGDSSKEELLRREHYDVSIVRTTNFKNDLKKILGEKELHLVLECIGGKIFQDSYDLLSSGGRLITYGSANFTPKSSSPNYFNVALNYLTRPLLDPLDMTTQNKGVFGFNLIWLYEKHELLGRYLDDLLKLEIDAQIIGKVFPFDNAIEAIQFFQSGKSVGKILLEV